MKARGKGQGINITSEFQTTLNTFKQQYTSTPPAKVPDFKPLVVPRHPRQDEIDAFMAIKSWKP